MWIIVFACVVLIIWAVGQDNRKKAEYAAEVAEARTELFSEENFCPSREPVRFACGISVFIDDESKRIAVEEQGALLMVGYSVLIGYELKEDNRTVLEGKFSEALTGAVLGDMFFDNATAGAVLGSAGSRRADSVCSSMTLGLKLNDIEHPYYEFSLIDGELDRDCSGYADARRSAGEVAALFAIVERQQKNGGLPVGKVMRYVPKRES